MPQLTGRSIAVGALVVALAFALALLLGRMTRPTARGPDSPPLVQAALAHPAIPVAALPPPVALPGLRPASASHTSGSGSAGGTNVATNTAGSVSGNGAATPTTTGAATPTTGVVTPAPSVATPPPSTTTPVAPAPGHGEGGGSSGSPSTSKSSGGSSETVVSSGSGG